jgi:hypothetical protein
MKAAIKNISLINFLRVGTIFLLLSFAARGADSDHRAHLYSGNDLSGWRTPVGDWRTASAVSLHPTNHSLFLIEPGNKLIVNGPVGKAPQLVTRDTFGDVQVHVEFCIPEHSNSGVYLMGRYEVQIYDSYKVEKDKYPGIECGGIYGRWIKEQNVEGHSPRVNVSKAPGEWQTFDITFRAPRFDRQGKKLQNARMMKVVHNGTVIHENVDLTGPTRSAMANDEKPTGPLRLQGDHGPVAFRNIKVEEMTLE